MGMPVTICLPYDNNEVFQEVFNYFKWIDEVFSPFKKDSEVSKLNRGQKYSSHLTKILKLAEETKKKTHGYFDVVRPDGKIDPSGIVKGWAIFEAAKIIKFHKYRRFYVDAGGDAEISGKKWSWGIRNPFNVHQIVKKLTLSDCGIATSGTYERGAHIYNPTEKGTIVSDIVSLSVIGPNVYEADRYATAAFAMGRKGIEFIENMNGLEGYMIDTKGIATKTTGFDKYLL